MKLNSQTKKYVALAGLILGSVYASAQDGYWVSKNQETAIRPGMTKSEVEQVIGRPPREARYGVAPGSTWVYGVAGELDVEANDRTVYEVDFNAQGQVISARERVIPIGGTRGNSTGY